jgi:hypothetical protein
VHTALAIGYGLMALLALAPAGYRWMYLNTDWLPGKLPREPEVGINRSWMPAAHAASSQGQVGVSVVLDPLRTSLACATSRTPAGRAVETHSVESCAAFAIPEDRLRQLLRGHRLREDGFDAFVNEDRGKMLPSAFQGLLAVASYRKKKDPLLERGESLLFEFARDVAGRRKLLSSGLLPNAEEWQRLTGEEPEAARGLRRFIIEWVGFLDPFFHVIFTNGTGLPVTVSKLEYTAIPRRTFSETTLIGSFDTPRYLFEIEEGPHAPEFSPPVIVPAGSTTAIDIVMRLKRPDPGVTYELRLAFLVAQPAARIELPTFSVAFNRASNP